MPTVTLYNTKGSSVGEVKVNDEVFTAKVKKGVLHSAVLSQLANERQGNASVKGKGEVRGGGKKPWRQKGTGNARHGSIRSPIWKGGGSVFGPRPRDYEIDLNKKQKRLAIKMAFADKFKNEKVVIIDFIKMSKPGTKDLAKILGNLKLSGQVLLVIEKGYETVQKSAANLKDLKVITVNNINIYDLLKYNSLLITKEALSKIEEVLA